MQDELLVLAERIGNSIQLGESHFREFKSAFFGPPNDKKPRSLKEICADIGEALVSFANADGGDLLIGVEDNGDVTGVPHKDEEIEKMLNAPISHVHADSKLPIQHSLVSTHGEKKILFFSVSKGTTEIFQLPDGRCVRRKDKCTVPETLKRIVFERQEVRSREYDRQFVDGATVSDLDSQILNELANKFLRGLSIERYLQQVGLAEYSPTGLRIRMAALLLFGKEISRWHPRSQVRIMEVKGTEVLSGEKYNVSKDKIAQGNIFDLLFKSWEELRFFLASKTEFGPEAKFEQRYTFPEQACREALVNAIAHRDYSVHNGIDIYIFDDRIEFRNPGALLSSLTIKDLLSFSGAHESRNANISRVLRENKFMRELGEGMKRLFEAMEESELEAPKIFSDSSIFSITLSKKSVFSDQQEHWLNVFRAYDLSSLQKRIVICGMDGREVSPEDIFKAINSEDLHVYQTEVTGLRNAGILIEIRSNVQAMNIARNMRVKKTAVARFKVQIPTTPIVSESTRRVFVSNLPIETDETQIRLHFESCGRVEKISLPALKPHQRFNRFAFVTFFDLEAAQNAIKTLNDSSFQGKTILVRKYIPKVG